MKKIRNVLILLFIVLISNVCFASGVGNLSLYTGTMKMLNDVTTMLLAVFPVVAVVLIVIFNICKSSAEQQEQQMWGKRIRTVVISLIIGECSAGLISWITSYYH